MVKMLKIINKDKCESLINLQKKILEWTVEYLKSDIQSLDDLHNHINKDDINAFRLHLFTNLNVNVDWKVEIMNIIGDEIRLLIGPDINIQKKINFSIQMPNDENSTLGLHSDSWTTESPFQLNVWIPMTDTFSSNSMFVLDQDKTFKLTKLISEDNFFIIPKNYFDDDDFLRMHFGQILIFNPSLLHGNITNTTNKTRISVHLRFKNTFAPEVRGYQDRATGIFYEILELSENTKFGLNYVEAAKGVIKNSIE